MSSSGNKAWMNKHRLSPEYLDGIVHFLEFTKKHGGGFKHFPCPCAKCRNGSGMIALNMIHEHLLINGIDESYTHWILHGECVATTNEKTTRSNPNEQPNNMYPRMEELVNDAFGRIGENVDALMDDLIRNRDFHEGSQEFQALSLSHTRIGVRCQMRKKTNSGSSSYYTKTNALEAWLKA
ncbi:hypothetical protein MRB53_005741 [Persea americana]|uniref:Uncharacterized protein n=1 Tax=Persea americana TaxID=3435 RepID=A0ACC2MF36_PERAE|nr:hypothetical protein MRB53_005741 [Persea americana]